MAGEADQTKWVGVRPTDPPEDLPVTLNGEVVHVIIDNGLGVTVKSLQIGSIVFTTEVVIYQPIVEVDRDYSIILFTGQAPAGADFRSCYVRLGWQNNTNIFGARGGNVHGVTVGFMVIEFDGLAKKVLHKNVICNGVTDNTTTIEARAMDRTLLIHNGCQTDFNAWGACLSRVWMDNITTLHCKKVDASGWTCTQIEVLEFPT